MTIIGARRVGHFSMRQDCEYIMLTTEVIIKVQ